MNKSYIKLNNIWFANTKQIRCFFKQQYSFYIVAVKIFIVNLNLYNINIIKLNIKPKLFATARALTFL